MKNYRCKQGERLIDVDIDSSTQIEIVTAIEFADKQEGVLIEIRPRKGFHLSFETEPVSYPTGNGLMIRIKPRVRG